MRRNSPTSKDLIVQEIGTWRRSGSGCADWLSGLLKAGPAGCTTHPHSFFGRLTPEEWAVLMYKHLDHHLRQFGVRAGGAASV